MNQENKQKGFMKNNILQTIIAIVIMAVISIAYFYPDAVTGNVLHPTPMALAAVLVSCDLPPGRERTVSMFSMT